MRADLCCCFFFISFLSEVKTLSIGLPVLFARKQKIQMNLTAALKTKISPPYCTFADVLLFGWTDQNRCLALRRPTLINRTCTLNSKASMSRQHEKPRLQRTRHSSPRPSLIVLLMIKKRLAEFNIEDFNKIPLPVAWRPGGWHRVLEQVTDDFVRR